MLKRLASATRITTAILMVVSILVPTTVAEATGTVTKRITVLDSNGIPAVGAKVTLAYAPTSGSAANTAYLDPVSTGQDGVAELTFADDLGGGTLYVQPASSDLVSSVYRQKGAATNSPLTVNLEKRIATISINDASGQPVGIGASISLSDSISDNYVNYMLFASGNSGITVNPSFSTDTCLSSEVFPPDTLQGVFYKSYGAKITGTGDSRVLKFYDDVNTCAVETAKINGVYQLKLTAGNISGYLRNAAGQPITFAPGQGYLVLISALNQDGNNDYSRMSAGSFVASDGFWTGYVDPSVAGKFEIAFSGFGSVNQPFFANQFVYATGNNTLSRSESLTNASATLANVNVNIPAPNFSVHFRESGTATFLESTFGIYKRIGVTSNYYMVGWASVRDTVTAANFSDGDYRVLLWGETQGPPPLFEFTVSGSSIQVTNQQELNGLLLGRSENNFAFVKQAANVKIRFVDSNGSSISTHVTMCTAQKVCQNGNTDSGGLFSRAFADGTYSYVDFVPQGSVTVGAIKTTATVIGGVITLNTGVQESDGSWTVTLPAANVRLNLVNPTTSDPLFSDATGNLGYIQILNANSNWQNTGYISSPQLNNSAGAGITLGEGRYLLQLNLHRGAEYSMNDGFAGRNYRITVASGVVSISDASGSPLTPSNAGVFTLSPHVANLDILVQDSAGATIAGNVEVSDKASNGETSNHQNSEISSTGHAYFYFNAAEGEVLVNPASSYANLARNKYQITFSAGTIAIENASNVGNAWVLQPSIPNIRMYVTDPNTNLALNGGYIRIQFVDSEWQGNETLDMMGTHIDIMENPQGVARTYLPNGNYIFNVTPYDNPENAGLAGRAYRVTVANSGVSITLNGVAVPAAVDGVFPLSPSASNFDVQVKKPNGDIFTNGSVGYCQIIETGCTRASISGGKWLSQTGTASLYLPDGTWQVSVNPSEAAIGVTSKTYEVVVAEGIPTVTGVTAPVAPNNVWVLTTGAPNLSGNFSVTSASNPLAFGNNTGISLQLQKRVNGGWQWQNGNGWSRSANWAMTVAPDAGEYRISARPWGLTDLVESYSDSFWVDSSGKFSMTETGTYEVTLSNLNIVLLPPNLKFKVVNPLKAPTDPDYPLTGGWITIEKVLNSNNRTWITNADIHFANPGLTGANIVEPGSYVLRVNPSNGKDAVSGLATKEYQMTIVSSDSVTITSGGNEVEKIDGRYILAVAKSNVSARIMRADGSAAVQGNNKWVSVNLQKLNSNGDWQWTTGSNTDASGYVSFRVDSVGKYRLRIEPYGDSQASVTYSSEFNVTAEEVADANYVKTFASITLAGPTIRVAVATADAPTTKLANTSIEIRKDGRWVDWANTSQGRIAGISLTSEGTYEFIVTPNQEQQSTNTRKSYKVNATRVDGSIVAEVVGGESGGVFVDVDGAITTLLLGTPTLSGTVKDPTGTILQPNSQVYAVDVASGREMWENSTNTNNLGRWSMMLPEGKYKIYARAPWGTSDFGGSSGVGEIVVSAEGTVSPEFATIEIRLKTPTWSGFVKAPTGETVIPQARVCLLISNNWICTNADQAGHFALSAPEFFETFTNTNPLLDIADDMGRAYPMNRIQGEEMVSGALGGVTNQNVVLRLKAPNTAITVSAVNDNGTFVASNLWVVAERDGEGYLGSGSTDINGVAKLNIASPDQPFKVRVEVNGNQEIAANFAPETRLFTEEDITGGTGPDSIFRGSIALSPPNFRFVVLDPTGNPVGNTWVELLRGSDGPWLGGTSVDYNGLGNFKLDVPETDFNQYTMTVNPSWNATTNFTRQAYAVAVSKGPDGKARFTVINKTSLSAVDTQTASNKIAYRLSLGTPSVTGVVVNPDSSTAANSWVVPFNAATNEGYWQQGVSSRNNGEIAMNLASGNYKLEANVPWGNSGVAKSAQCAITVESGTISATGGDCIQLGEGTAKNTVRLQLRAPNVKFTLKIGDTPIANANVGVSAGRWWTNAQSNSQGVVSLFIDADAIRELNNSNEEQRLWFWVDPPYGSSIMARWSCGSGDIGKPICEVLPNVPAVGSYGDYTEVNGAPWVVQGVEPNTILKIVTPNTHTALPNSWVSIFAMNEYGNQWWLAGGNSGNNGRVAMNIETETAFSLGYDRLVVEVQAPWNQRNLYAANLYTNNGEGYTYESLTAILDFSPATPNLKLTIKDSNRELNRYGWVGIEELNQDGNPIKWVGGYSLNEYGQGAVFLAASKSYRITSYPGPGRAGVATACTVSADSATPPVVATETDACSGLNVVAGALEVRLNGGNVIGLVTRVINGDVVPVAGAAVYANIGGAATEDSAVIAVTDETGRYDLQLTPNEEWNIKVFPVPSATDPLAIETYPDSVVAPSNGLTPAEVNFTLEAPIQVPAE